jgi:hypothetical protein
MSNPFKNIENVSIEVNKSSLLSNIEWEKLEEGNDPKGNLTITFNHDEERYIYTDVPSTILLGMLITKSAGSYFHKNIKDKYPTFKEIE